MGRVRLNLKAYMSSQLYEGSALQSLPGRPLLQHPPLQTTERAVLTSALHVLLGMPSPLFPLAHSRFSLTPQPLLLTHLAADSLLPCLQDIAETASRLQFVREEARRVYAMGNALLRAFAEGALMAVHGVEEGFTGQLRELQQERGQLSRSQAEYEHSREHPLTLMTLLQAARAQGPLLTFLVSAFSRLALRESPSPSDLQTAVLFLLNLYHEECARESLLPSQLGARLHALFGGLLRGYLRTVEEWLEMDERALAVKAELGFFVDLAQSLAVEEDRIFEVQRITRKEAVPELFRGAHERVVELGKTVQFIKLYFGPEERQRFRAFLDVPALFAPLHAFLARLQGPPPAPFFAPRKANYHTISSRLAAIVRPTVTVHKIERDNPFNIYPEITGVLSLRSDYRFPEKERPQPDPIHPHIQSTQSLEGRDTNAEFGRLLWGALEAVGERCLGLLQEERVRGSIERTLQGVKRFMLFEQGDFLQEFLELTRDLFERPAEKISRNNIERLVEEALRSSRAAELPEAIRENVTFSFLRNTQGVKAWRIFALTYRPEPPTQCLFPAKLMADYACLSNMLFNLRHCEAVLSEAWRGEGRGVGGEAGVLKARNAVHHFLKALQGFLFAQLETQWGQLVEGIARTGNALAILELNERALARIRAATFENAPLCNTFLSLVKITDRFQSIRTALEQGQDHSLREDVEQIWLWFAAMRKQSELIPHFEGIAEAFDFRIENIK